MHNQILKTKITSWNPTYMQNELKQNENISIFIVKSPPYVILLQFSWISLTIGRHLKKYNFHFSNEGPSS